MFVEKKKTSGHYRQVSVARRNSKMWCHGKGREEGTQLQCLYSHSMTSVISKKQLYAVCAIYF